MKPKILIPCLILLTTFRLSAEVSWETLVGKEVYKFTLTQEQFDKLPDFDPLADANPDLSRVKAVEIANKSISKIPAPEGMKWEVISISLYQAKEFFARPGKWLWRVRYSVVPTQIAGGFAGALPEYELAVLMDGTVLTGEK